MPAYRFVRFDYIPPVSAEPLSRIARLMRQREGFFLTASLRQDRKSRGTLLALEGPGAHRQFELVSNGPADTLDLTYWVDGAQHVLSLEDVGLADAQWKNITVQVAAETFSLHVGCALIDSFALDEPFYEQLVTDKSKMYVAKGSARESHFRVRMSRRCMERKERRPWASPGQGPSRHGSGTHTHVHTCAHIQSHMCVHAQGMHRNVQPFHHHTCSCTPT